LNLFTGILFVMIMGYVSYGFIRVLLKMKQSVILPVTEEERLAIRKHPEKPIDSPIYSKQKKGIIIYFSVLVFISVMFVLGVSLQLFDWPFYLLLLLPVANAYNLLNLFAVLEDGLLSGRRFIAWKHIKSFQFVPIDIDHRYYGFTKEANVGYELKIKTSGFSVSCVVTSIEMKEKLIHVFNGQLVAQEASLS